MQKVTEETQDTALDRLAAAYGIEPEYIDNWGHIHKTSANTKEKLLNAMGIAYANPNEALRARDEKSASRLTETTIVASITNMPKTLELRLPADWYAEGLSEIQLTLVIFDEYGETQNHQFTFVDISQCNLAGHDEVSWCQAYLAFPHLDRLGYYEFRLAVRLGTKEKKHTMLVAVCPDKAYLPTKMSDDGRIAGIALSLYAVRSDDNWGVGDFADLKRIVDWVVDDLHGGIIGLNPLHALFNRRPYNISPYSPSSRLYKNFIYLDIMGIADYQGSSDAQQFVQTPETQRLLKEVRAARHVEYEKVAAIKNVVLRKIFKWFLDHHWGDNGQRSDRGKEFEQYLAREGQMLDNYAVFCALDNVFHTENPDVWVWKQWPEEYHRCDTDSIQEFKQEHWREILFHKYVQWQLELQLSHVQEYAKQRGMLIGLYHDLAVASDRCGADFWAYQNYFLHDARVGAPPDAFALQGQDWGCPPPNIENLRESGYKLFIKEIQKNCMAAGALRIDHAMRLFRLYCIPKDEPPKDGTYLRQPYEDLLKILMLESVKNQVVIIGEDLGTVPPLVREVFAKSNVFSYRLLYFERAGQDRRFLLPERYPELALVSAATHDLPTLAGFWSHRDIAIRKQAGFFDSEEAICAAAAEREDDKKKLLDIFCELGLLPSNAKTDAGVYSSLTREVQEAAVSFLASTQAKLLVISQEDLFMESEQQNLPGTIIEYPNWSQKMKYSVEQLRTDEEAKALSKMFQSLVDKNHRNKNSPAGHQTALPYFISQ